MDSKFKKMHKLSIALAIVAFIGFVSVESCDSADKPCAILFTKKMQQEIVDYHNEVRSKASPPAKNMQKIYWDDTMAEMAREHIIKCVFDHNKPSDRSFAGYTSVGQNLWAGGARFKDAVSPAHAWWQEVKYFTFGKSSTHIVGHYTQVMRGPTARIGCAAAYCPNHKWKYLVECNYLEGQYNFKTPYKPGKTCAHCPRRCKNGLCDCGGKVCQNGGKLNLNRCSCRCPGVFRGKTCEKARCRKKDRRSCKYYKKSCDPIKYGHWIRSKCPYTCGVCK